MAVVDTDFECSPLMIEFRQSTGIVNGTLSSSKLDTNLFDSGQLDLTLSEEDEVRADEGVLKMFSVNE